MTYEVEFELVQTGKCIVSAISIEEAENALQWYLNTSGAREISTREAASECTATVVRESTLPIALSAGGIDFDDREIVLFPESTE